MGITTASMFSLCRWAPGSMRAQQSVLRRSRLERLTRHASSSSSSSSSPPPPPTVPAGSGLARGAESGAGPELSSNDAGAAKKGVELSSVLRRRSDGVAADQTGTQSPASAASTGEALAPQAAEDGASPSSASSSTAGAAANPLSMLFRRQKLRRRDFRWRLDNSSAVVENEAAAPKLKLNKVLVVSKISRFEHERESHPLMSDGDLKSLLAQRGSDYAGLKRRYDQHTSALNSLLDRLRERNVTFDVVRTPEAHTVRDLTPYDAVLSAGGDGTFLTAASLVLDNTPVIGFNTDSERSEGHLCVRRRGDGGPRRRRPLSYAFILDSLLSGAFTWQKRQRIRISVNTGHIHGPLLMRRRALNDVLFAADHTYDATYYELHLNGGVGQKQKSSGLLAATGTGSTAWLKCAAKVSEQYVHEVLRAAAKHAAPSTPAIAAAAGATPTVSSDGTALRDDHERSPTTEAISAPAEFAVPTPTSELVNAVTDKLNRRITFDPARLEMGWLVREPIVNGIFKVEQDHGFAREILIRSRCPSAQIIADGQPFHRKISDGHSVKLNIYPEDCLWTVSHLDSENDPVYGSS